jgi:acetyl esterase
MNSDQTSSQRKAYAMNKLDPQVKALLDQFHANAAPPRVLSAGEKIAAARQRVKAAAALGMPYEAVARVNDIDLPGPAGNIAARLYIPMAETLSPKPVPTLVYYHGGGFVAEDLDSHDTLLRALANRAQCIVVSVDYRLAPEHPYPAANDDAWAALTWIAEHAMEIGADPMRLAVGGDSAGGLLAAWVAQKAKEHPIELRLQVLLYPNLDATTSSASWKASGTGAYGVSHAEVQEWYDAYLPKGIPRRDRQGLEERRDRVTWTFAAAAGIPRRTSAAHIARREAFVDDLRRLSQPDAFNDAYWLAPCPIPAFFWAFCRSCG